MDLDLTETDLDGVTEHSAASGEKMLACAVLAAAVQDAEKEARRPALKRWTQSRNFDFWVNVAGLEEGAVQRLTQILTGERQARWKQAPRGKQAARTSPSD